MENISQNFMLKRNKDEINLMSSIKSSTTPLTCLLNKNILTKV